MGELWINYTVRKVSLFGVILVRIFPHSDWIRTRITPNTDTFYAALNITIRYEFKNYIEYFTENFCDYYCLNIIMNTTLKYYHKQVFNKTLKLMAVVMIFWKICKTLQRSFYILNVLSLRCFRGFRILFWEQKLVWEF